MTVDALRLGLNEYVLLVWAHLIAVYSVYLDAVLDVVHIEEHARLLSRSETVGDNLLAVPGNLTVSFAIQEWCNTVNSSLGIYAICEVPDCQTVCFGEEYSTKECHKSYDSSHHIIYHLIIYNLPFAKVRNKNEKIKMINEKLFVTLQR